MVGYLIFSSGIPVSKRKWIILADCRLCSVFRYKGNSPDRDKQVGVAVPDVNIARCEGDFADRDCSISMETGDLTLGSVRIEDEGPYVCRKTFSDGTWDKLRQLNVNGKVFAH